MSTVPPERWRRIEEVLDGALDLAPGERAAFLDRECEGDPTLRSAVDALLRASEQTSGLPPSPVSLAAPFLAQLASEEHHAGAAPERVGPWRIIRALGHGGMGTVYLAERDDEQFRKQVAVKLLRHGLGSDELTRRFRHERQILATLEHPHIARMLDGGIADGAPYIVMEFIDGVPLDAHCRERGLPVAARLSLFADVCEAVQYAHQHLVIHRDLKPSNILVTDDGVVKLLDFGIAKLVGDDGTPGELRLTRTGMYLMTPEYAAPEQVRGGQVTTATDVYALGMILYELLVGRRPYQLEGRSPAEMERVICDTEPPRPSTAARRASAGRAAEQLGRRLRGDLDTIILKALHKDPQRRYPSAAALLDDIRRHQHGLPVHARPDTFAYRARKFAGRNRVAVGLSALAFAAVLAGAVRERTIRAQAEFEAAKARAVKDYLVGVFGASDPYDTSPERGRTMTAQALLDRGRARVDTAFSAQPEIRDEMLTVLGGVYANLGLYDDAAALHERALAGRRQLHGDRHESVAESMTELGDVYLQQGKYREAEPMLRDALALRRSLFGNESERVARSADRLATVLEQQARYADAEPLYREALAIRERLLGPRHADVAESKLNLALLLWWKGEYDASERLNREALELRKAMLGPRHAMVGEAMHNLAQVQQSRGELSDAEDLFRESLAIKREVFGTVHPRITVHLNNYARVLRDRGKYAEAEPLYREALALDHTLFGDEHPYISASMDNLAGLLTDRGKFAEADSLHRRALAMNRKLLGPRHTRVALGLSNIALLHFRRGELAEAERTYREALAQYREIFGPDHIFTHLVSSSLAAVLRDRGTLDESEALYRAALKAIEGAGTQSWIRIAPILTGYGRTLVAAGRPAEARPVLERALGMLSGKLGSADWRIAEARLGLGSCLGALGERTEAEKLLRESRDALQSHAVAQQRLLRAAEAALAAAQGSSSQME